MTAFVVVDRVLRFWFDFASTYSYLTAPRIKGSAVQHGVTVEWCPFLLGPIVAARGWQTSPFNLYPDKGRQMWPDMERRAALYGLAFRRPTRFPQNGLYAARVAPVGLKEGWAPTFLTDCELFWGDDRLEDAISWCVGRHAGRR